MSQLNTSIAVEGEKKKEAREVGRSNGVETAATETEALFRKHCKQCKQTEWSVSRC